MSAEYESHRIRSDAQYVDEYWKWIESLPPDERKKLKENGVSEPNVPQIFLPNKNTDEKTDPAESAMASYLPDVSGNIDQLADVIAEMGVSRAISENLSEFMKKTIEIETRKRESFFLHRIVAEFLGPGNLRLRAYALCFACGLDSLNGMGSQSQAAVECGVTRSAISKLVVRWSDLLEIKNFTHRKSEKARKKFSEIQTASHWRNRLFKQSEQLPVE